MWSNILDSACLKIILSSTSLITTRLSTSRNTCDDCQVLLGVCLKDCSTSFVEKERLEAMVTSLTQQVAQLEAKLKASETESMRLRKMLEDNGFSLEI